jgi:hypothetical protein
VLHWNDACCFCKEKLLSNPSELKYGSKKAYFSFMSKAKILSRFAFSRGEKHVIENINKVRSILNI